MNIFLHNELWREIKYLLLYKNISIEEYINYVGMDINEIKKLRKASPDEYPAEYLHKIFLFVHEHFDDELKSPEHSNIKHVAKNVLVKVTNAYYIKKNVDPSLNADKSKINKR